MLDLLVLVLDLLSADQEIQSWDLFLRASEEHKCKYIVFLVIFFSVNNSQEQATSQRLHLAMSCDGFGNGMKTFLPDSCNSLRDFAHLSRYLESVLHSPQQQCLVETISCLLKC